MQNSKAIDAENGLGYTFELSGEPYRPSADLVNQARHFQFAHHKLFETWQKMMFSFLTNELNPDQLQTIVGQKLVREGPAIADGHIASGPPVAASKSFIEQIIKQRDRKYLALEMELGGVLAALDEAGNRSRSLVVRGISDFGDNRKNQLDNIRGGGLRRYAIVNTIKFLWKLLEVDALPRSTLQQNPQ